MNLRIVTGTFSLIFIIGNDNHMLIIIMHKVWKGAIPFGLVTIPVKLNATTEDKGIKLRWIQDK
jgi:hypothetical protein